MSKDSIERLETLIIENDDKINKKSALDVYVEIIDQQDLNQELLYDSICKINDKSLTNKYITYLSTTNLIKLIEEDKVSISGVYDNGSSLPLIDLITIKDNIDFESLPFSFYHKHSIDDISNLLSAGIELNWNRLSMKCDLTINFINTHKDNLNWTFLSSNVDFDETHINEYFDLIDWNIGRSVQDLALLSDENYDLLLDMEFDNVNNSDNDNDETVNIELSESEKEESEKLMAEINESYKQLGKYIKNRINNLENKK